MHILGYIIPFAVFCLAPALVLWLCARVKALDRIGPIFILYILGAILGNLPAIGVNPFPEELSSVQEALSSVTVPLAIPLLLFGCVFKRSETRTQVLSMVSGMVAVAIAVVAGFLIFRGPMTSPDDPLQAERVGAMMVGTYVGGTVNMASIQKMLGVPGETFVIANTFDMVVSLLYLIFLMTVGIKLFRRLLPGSAYDDGKSSESSSEDASGDTAKAKVPLRDRIVSGAKSIGCAAAIFALSYLVATFVNSKVDDDVFMVVFILLLTTLGIAMSFVKPVRNLPLSNNIGMYLIYVFSIVVASMADFTKMDFSQGAGILGFLLFVVFGSLLLHALFAKILRIDADTMVITSVAYINSPPFVPVISGVMHNRNVLAPGLAIGVVGYAVGNYLGLLIFKLLCLL